MDGRNSSFCKWQFVYAAGVECGDDHPIVLNRFGIIKRSFVKRRGIASFDSDDFGDAVGRGEFELISGQRRVFGIDIDIHCAEATAAFLTRRLLGAKRRWLKEQS